MEKYICHITQNILQWQTKKQRNYNITFMRNLNVPKNNVILTSLEMCGCYKSIDNVVVA